MYKMISLDSLQKVFNGIKRLYVLVVNEWSVC